MKGFILKSLSGVFYVYCLTDNKIYNCKVRGQIRNQKLKPICGDNVDFIYDEGNDFSLITNIEPRKNELKRPPIANIDVALIIMSTIKPNFDSYLIDKLIVAARCENIEPVIILSKCEHIDDEIDNLLNNYELAGYQVIRISSHLGLNIEKVHKTIENKKVVLCGQSAVGKSSLINSLLEEKERLIGEYSEKLGRGKHQTREVEFIKILDAFVADTPGFSSLEIKLVDLNDYSKAFKDFEKYSKLCKYGTCMHINEPECEVKKAVENGLINKKRYENYIHLYNEIKDGKHVWKKK